MTTGNLTTGSPLVGELTPGRLGENTGALPVGGSTVTHHSSTTTGTTGVSGLPTSHTGTHTGSHMISTGTGSGLTSHTGSHVPGVNGTHTSGMNGASATGNGLGTATGAATGAGTGTALGQGTSTGNNFGRTSGMATQQADGSHTVAGVEHIGTGYTGPAAKRGDISAPTGSLPAGTVEKGATNQPIPRPSAKDYFKMSNADAPSNPTALANRPVGADPISEADHVAPTHGGHSGTPGNMVSSTPQVRQEGVDAYAASSHGDHLTHGTTAGTGYAGAAAARGDTTAPTGTLPPGAIEAGLQNKNVPRPSAKDQFLMNNAASPSNPVALAKRLFRKDTESGTATQSEITK